MVSGDLRTSEGDLQNSGLPATGSPARREDYPCPPLYTGELPNLFREKLDSHKEDEEFQ